MSSKAYLKLRGHRWYVQVAVPHDLQKQLGKKVVVRALGTADYREAQRLRWPRVAKIKEAFDRARGGEAMTAGEIEAAAAASFTDRLQSAADVRAAGGAPYRAVPDGHDTDPEEAGLELVMGQVGDALLQDDFSLVRDEAAAIIANSGAHMPSDSVP